MDCAFGRFSHDVRTSMLEIQNLKFKIQEFSPYLPTIAAIKSAICPIDSEKF
jgi:hypothetical protein